jgi:EAL domain-containing protein (putative c-di-GMP-specific phosphodiesterase class I)
LKIDRSFVNQMTENEENIAIVRTIVALAQNLGMDVVAEGVETDDQLNLLRKLDCENGQGYLFSTPLDVNDVDQFIAISQAIVEEWQATEALQLIDAPHALVA